MDKRSHPIHGRRYVINTQPLQRFIWAVQRWMAMGTHGACAYGFPRVGKTQMARAACSKLRTRSGEIIPAYHIPQKTTSISTDRKFWSFLLSGLNIAHGDRASAKKLYDSLLGFLRNEAESNSEKRVVLFLDEAQKLSKFHYELLQDLMNDLTDSEVNPFFVFVGSNLMPNRLAEFDPIKDAGLRDRFFSAMYRVHGLRGPVEVEHALLWYDKAHEAMGIEEPFTKALLPRQHAAGFRMAPHAKLLWRSFLSEVRDEFKEIGWGMQYFHATVRNLLVDLIDEEGQLSSDLAGEAIRNSGILGPLEEDDGVAPEVYEDA